MATDGDWLEEFPKELTDLAYQVALYDPQSRNEEDQCDQKELWITLHSDSLRIYEERRFSSYNCRKILICAPWWLSGK